MYYLMSCRQKASPPLLVDSRVQTPGCPLQPQWGVSLTFPRAHSGHPQGVYGEQQVVDKDVDG